MNSSANNKIYIGQNNYYTVFKKKGRVIFAPSEKLKAEQKEFLKLLRQSFPLNLSIKNAAKCHKGKKWVLKMDIAGFYDSVPFEDIKEIVKITCKKNLPFSNIECYTQLVTLDEKLPTGAPTSAHIANACFMWAETRVKRFCFMYGVDYSRYMDDLTFSCDDKSTLNSFEVFVREILNDNGYKVNEKKIKYISDNRCQNVLGLVVNGDQARIPNRQKRQIRAMLHSFAVSNCSNPIQSGASALASSYKHLAWNEAR